MATPVEGTFKVNTDASFSPNELSAGLGIIASVNEAEAFAFAVLEGLRLAMDAGIYPVQLETHSLSVFNLSDSFFFREVCMLLTGSQREMEMTSLTF